jgi:hypothetical protein
VTVSTIDLSRTHKELYSAKRSVKKVKAAKAVFLAVDGQGPPGGDRFQRAIQGLYGMAYTIKFTLKAAGRDDYTVSKLECLHRVDDPARTPKEEWKWRLMVRVPESVTPADLADARRNLKERKGLDASDVQRLVWAEGVAVQTLHVGPYDQVGQSYARLEAFARENGLATTPPGHEIYISDPRRVAPERLKTIVRLPVQRA